MAIGKTSPILSEIRGSIGDTNFRMSAHGLIVSKKAPSIRRQSFRQTESEIYLSQAADEWSSLDSDTRNYWKTACQDTYRPWQSMPKRRMSPRDLFFAWRIRALHCNSSIAANTIVPMPIFRPRDFVQDFLTQFNGIICYPEGLYGVSGEWKGAYWISFSDNGTRCPGRVYRKYWPLPGHYDAYKGSRLEEPVFDLLGWPIQVPADASGAISILPNPYQREVFIHTTGYIEYAEYKNASTGSFPYYWTYPFLSPVFTS